MYLKKIILNSWEMKTNSTLKLLSTELDGCYVNPATHCHLALKVADR